MSTYAVGDEMTLQAIARDAASTDPAQPHLDHYPRYYGPPPVPQGWQCPVCKTVYAPSVTMCRCAKVEQWQGTVTGGGIATKPQTDQEADSEIPPMPKPLGVNPYKRKEAAE